MGFSDLPPEIVLMILDCIDTTAALKDICLLSKTFCALTQPHLYREIVLGPEDVPLSILLLCRTIITSPFIAAQVQVVDIDTSDSGFIVAERPDKASGASQAGLSAADIRHLKMEAQKINLSDTDPSGPILWTADFFIFPMLLISCTPNLKSLIITLEPQGLALLIGLAQGRNNAHQSLSCLGSLESLHLGCRQGRRGDEINIRSIAQLLSLLYLNEIKINDYCAGGEAACDTITAADIPLGSPYISTISLSDSSIEETDIGVLIRSCEKLAAFCIGQCSSQSEQLSPQQLYSVLFCQRNNLRVLQLSFCEDSFASSSIFKDSYFISLEEFICLEYLTLDQVYLSHTPELPVSLKHLAVRECQSPIAQSLVYIAELALNGQLPNLSVILLHSDIIYPGQMLNLPQRGATDILFNEACQKLQRILVGTGITLCLENDLLDKTVQGYGAAFQDGQPGVWWPLVYLQ
ncbi:hypothetical protein BDW75DRAFT_42565 [Aspergillus navahoensis]